MQDKPSVLQAVVALEPWRQRVGYPSSVTDPMWEPSKHTPCAGEILREAGTKYWHCTKCGYIGWSTSTTHYPVLTPWDFLDLCKSFYEERRKQQGLNKEQMRNESMYLMGLALRFAAMKSPEELRDFIEKMARL